MKCSVVRKNILRWLDGETPDAMLQRDVDSHLARCERCTRWGEYLEVIENGPEDIEIPSFELSPRVAAAIQAEDARSPSRTVLSFRLSMAVILGVMVALAGIYRFVSQKPPEEVSIKWVQTDGHAYKVVRLDPAASFNSDYLKPPSTPALQSEVSRQLAFLSDSLASALRSANESLDWEALRGALEKQKIRVSSTQPKFVVLSRQLAEVLQMDNRDAELWVIQTADSMLLFTLLGEGEW
jgi:hypothetical protein